MDKQTYNTLKKEVEWLKKLPGRQRGEHIKYYVNYVKKNHGEKGLKKVKDTLKEMDFDIGDVERLTDTKWISEAIPHTFFVASARIFGWSEEEIFNMGKAVVLESTITKIFVKYFSSIRKTMERGVKQWNKNFTRGKLELKNLNENKKEGSFILKDFQTHPLACVHFEGFFTRILKIATGSDKAKVEEVKCMSQGDEYHEFYFKW